MTRKKMEKKITSAELGKEVGPELGWEARSYNKYLVVMATNRGENTNHRVLLGVWKAVKGIITTNRKYREKRRVKEGGIIADGKTLMLFRGGGQSAKKSPGLGMRRKKKKKGGKRKEK